METKLIEPYISSLANPNQKKLMQELHAFLSTYDYLTGKIRFNIPFYYGNTWICYLNPVKPDKVELVFLRGKQLPSNKLLDARNRKMVKGLMLQAIDDIPYEIIDLLVKEAIALDSRPETVDRSKT